jgi:hypothetical protein
MGTVPVETERQSFPVCQQRLTVQPTERPALIAGAGPSECRGGSLFYACGFGCFNLNPAPGVATISRNYGRGPGQVNLNLRVARSWAFGSRGESGVEGGGMVGIGGVKGGGMPPPDAIPGGGPPAGMFGAQSGKKYNLTLSASAWNALPSTYNRRIMIQLRLMF